MLSGVAYSRIVTPSAVRDSWTEYGEEEEAGAARNTFEEACASVDGAPPSVAWHTIGSSNAAADTILIHIILSCSSKEMKHSEWGNNQDGERYFRICVGSFRYSTMNANGGHKTKRAGENRRVRDKTEGRRDAQ
jgi:hypothetical protein